MKRITWALPLVLLVVLAFGTFRLTESPAIWGDEGMIVELSVNLIRHGQLCIQTAPGECISPAFTTTGFPVTFPVALSFALFDIGILQARAVMVAFMLLCVGAAFLLIERIHGKRQAICAALLVATFAPFYGNGKNVLGEVPGLLFLLVFLFCAYLIDMRKQRRPHLFVFAGLAVGLCIVTKPIFLLLLPAIVTGFVLVKKEFKYSVQDIALFLAGFLLPVFVWTRTQFLPSDSLNDILAFYSNPYTLDDIGSVVVQNLFRFVSEKVPLYLFGLFGIWSASLLPRLWKGRASIPLVEAISFVFVSLILLAYLRTPGWYRYFFPAQILTFLFVPEALRHLASVFRSRLPNLSYAPAILLSGLILMQTYQTGYDSWVADWYPSTFTRDLNAYFAEADPNTSYFLHTVPELIPFLPSDRFYQYIELNDQRMGEAGLEKLEEGVPDVLLIYDRRWDASREQFPLYEEKTRVARYVIAERKGE